jgi:hypothetical protein
MNLSIAPTNERPDYAQEVIDRLTRDYDHLLTSVSDVTARFAALPETIRDEYDLSQYGAVIADARELKKRLDAYHDAEKAPYLNGGRGCDNFFFGEIDRLIRRSKGAAPGWIDIADSRVDSFMQEKLRAERARRQAEEEAMRAKLRAAEEAAEAARRAEQEALAKAARARNQANIDANRAKAAEEALAAEKARQQAALAAQQAEDARIDTLATAADMTRTRLDSGHLATMKQVPFVQVVDRRLLDRGALWAHFKDSDIEAALKSWAKTTEYKCQMAGAVIEMRNKGQLK